MALFYQGPRPVLKGRSAADNVNPYTGKVGVYSNWSIFNTSHVLDGAPNKDHVPGSGEHPYGLQMSRWFTGLANRTQPLKDPGLGPVLTWFVKHSSTLIHHGGSQDIFGPEYGHERRVTSYSQWDPWIYRGTTPAPLTNEGHVQRTIGAPGTASSFGTLGLYTYHGTTPPPLSNEGLAIADKPTGLDHGFQRVNEWKGVPSSRVL